MDYMKVNLIFDGNYLFHKTLGAFKNYTEKESGSELTLTELFNEVEYRAQFFRKLIIDFCNTVRCFDSVERIIFVFDEQSWRKEVNETYKKKEKSDVDLMIDKENEEGWTHFYAIMEKFKRHMESAGFPCSQLLNFEGDDLCYFYAREFSHRKEYCIIVTGDKDILQNMDEYVSVYRNNSLAPSYFYAPGSSLKSIGNKIKERVKKLKVEEVDPIKHLFVKILIGDKGDNVPNIFQGMGEKTALGLYEICKGKELIGCHYHDIDYIRELVKVIQNKFPKKKLDHYELCYRITDNAQLMWLNDSVYTFEQRTGVAQEIKRKINSYSYNGDFILSEILNKK